MHYNNVGGKLGHMYACVGPEQSLVKAEKSHSINNRQVTLCAPNIKQSNIGRLKIQIFEFSITLREHQILNRN